MAEEIDNVKSEEEEGPDYLDLSDEDFAKESAPDVISIGSEDVDKLSIDEPKEEIEDIPSDKQEAASEVVKDEPIAEEGEEPKEVVSLDAVSLNDIPAIDYEAEYKKFMAPFKANGSEITPKSPEDAIRFMQMGANYHKKMAGMKPALKALKTLENNDLLDESKLDFLIDLHQGKPEAITKLMKESKIDPLDVDVSAETAYTPTNHSASDVEVELDSVLESIQESPSYTKTLTTITKEWDESSRNEAAIHPQILTVINEHMDSGVYDKVMTAVNYDRSVGKLSNVSDLEAYKAIGNRLEQEGAVRQVAAPKSAPVTQPDLVKEQQRQAQKKAASPTKTTSKVSKLPSNFNPLNLSDEEFNKFDPKTIGL